MDLAMDSACDLAPSAETCPPRVTTPLSRSWLTETSLRPASSSECRRPSEISADFVGEAAQPPSVPATISAESAKQELRVFMLVPSARDAPTLGRLEDIDGALFRTQSE